MLALSPKAETVGNVPNTCSNGTLGDPCHLWVAIDRALGDVDEWAECYTQCTFVDRGLGRALAIEKTGSDQLRICHQRLGTALHLGNVAVWLLSLDAGSVHDVTLNGVPADIEGMEELADALWAFHRLAVEDRASMLRS